MKSKGGNMSQFDKYSTSEYVDGLRVFLKKKREDILAEAGLLPPSPTYKPGRPGRRVDEAMVVQLEKEVNAKAAMTDAVDTTIGERIKLAIDYKSFSAAQVANAMGVSQELVRLWGENVHRPGDIEELATVLDIPAAWLEFGGAQHLPANSHLGVRVGQESFECREFLYAKTLELIPSIPESAGLEYTQALIEYHVHTNPTLANLARKAGGRWQVLNERLVFAPWVPIEPYQLNRQKWSDEIEAMVAEELSSKPSVYGAYASLKNRCEAMGLKPGQYPSRISLHKRVEKERDRTLQYGLNLNNMIKISMEEFKIS